MLHIVLFEPEIPQNTGNIVRTASVTGVRLHLIEPLGFEISDKQLKRAGLDYWSGTDIVTHESYDAFLDYCRSNISGGVRPQIYYVETDSKYRYDEADYTVDKDIYLVFGSETKGLPKEILRDNYDYTLSIPMRKGSRSLNLANCVAIVLYEALRQRGFTF